MTEEGRRSLTAKDWLAFTFSTAALLLSCVGFYFSNFRVDDSLQARIADATNDAEFTPVELNLTSNVLARVVFINAGNRPALVLWVKHQLSDPSNSSKGLVGAECSVPKNTWPLLVPPHEMRLVDLRVPVTFLTYNLDMGSDTPGSVAPNKVVQFGLGLEFFVVDSSGQSHDVISEPFSTLKVDKGGLIAVSSVYPAHQYPAVSLFQQR